MATTSNRGRAAAKAAVLEETELTAGPLDPNVTVLITQDGRAIPPATHGVAGIDPPAEGCFVLAEQDASRAQLLLAQQTQDAPAEPEAEAETVDDEVED